MQHRCFCRTLAIFATVLVAAKAIGDGASPYAELSNEALSELAKNLQSLDSDERRALLIEMHKRKAIDEARFQIPQPHHAGFGRTTRDVSYPDGWAGDAAAVQATARDVPDYGAGFERRGRQGEGRGPSTRQSSERKASEQEAGESKDGTEQR